MHAEEPAEGHSSQFSSAPEKFHQRISYPGDGGKGRQGRCGAPEGLLGKRQEEAGEIRPEGGEDQQDFENPQGPGAGFIFPEGENPEQMEQEKKKQKAAPHRVDTANHPPEGDLLIHPLQGGKGLGEGGDIMNQQKNPRKKGEGKPTPEGIGQKIKRKLLRLHKDSFLPLPGLNCADDDFIPLHFHLPSFQGGGRGSA